MSHDKPTPEQIQAIDDLGGISRPPDSQSAQALLDYVIAGYNQARSSPKSRLSRLRVAQKKQGYTAIHIANGAKVRIVSVFPKSKAERHPFICSEFQALVAFVEGDAPEQVVDFAELGGFVPPQGNCNQAERKNEGLSTSQALVELGLPDPGRQHLTAQQKILNFLMVNGSPDPNRLKNYKYLTDKYVGKRVRHARTGKVGLSEFLLPVKMVDGIPSYEIWVSWERDGPRYAALPQIELLEQPKR